MGWNVESGWRPFATLFQLLLPIGLAVAILAFAQRSDRGARRLALLAAAGIVGLAALLIRLDGAVAKWESAATAAPSAVVDTLRFAAFPLLLALAFALFAWPAARGRWHEAYVALVAGPGLGGLVAAAKLAFPRQPPVAHPFFGTTMGFPDDVAALALGLAILAPWLAWRLRPTSTRIGWLIPIPFAFVLGALPWLAGTAWTGDLLAGWLLTLAWVPLVLAASSLARDIEQGVGWPGRFRVFVLRGVDAVLRRPVAWLVGIIAFGVVLRVASFWWTPLGIDTYAYAAMARSFLDTDTFTMPWGDLHTFLDAPVASHHYPPLYPVLVAGFEQIFGTTRAALHLAGITTGLLAILVAYLCSRNLYGHRKALVVAAVVAASPIFVQNTGQAYSENLVLVLFTITLWAILRSLERPAFIILAGALAGLAYLAKSSMGYFFVIAGLGGLVWRLRWRGLKVLRDPAYLAAIAIFGALVLAWAWRNWRLFGNWETSHHLSAAYAAGLAEPGAWLLLSLVTLVFYATLGYLVYLGTLPVLPTLARAPKLQSEHDSGLWLALGLPLLLTAVIDAALWLKEGDFRLDNARYIGFVAIPAAWLLVRHADLRKPSVRVGAIAVFALLLTGSLFFGKPATSTTDAIGEDLGALMQEGEALGFVDVNNHFVYKFAFYANLEGKRDLEIVITCAVDPACPPEAKRPEVLDTEWVVMRGDGDGRLPAPYRIVEGTHAATDTAGQAFTIWRRA